MLGRELVILKRCDTGEAICGEDCWCGVAGSTCAGSGGGERCGETRRLLLRSSITNRISSSSVSFSRPSSSMGMDDSTLGRTLRLPRSAEFAEDDGDVQSMLSALLSLGFGRGVVRVSGLASSTRSLPLLLSPLFGGLRDEGDGTTNRFAGITRVASSVSSCAPRECRAVGLGVCTWRRPDRSFCFGLWEAGGAGARKRCGEGVWSGILL